MKNYMVTFYETVKYRYTVDVEANSKQEAVSDAKMLYSDDPSSYRHSEETISEGLEKVSTFDLNKLKEELKNYTLDSKDSLEELINELKHYKKEFPYEIDYNWYTYGNSIISTFDIREFYNKCDCEVLNEVMDDDQIIDDFKCRIRQVIDEILDENGDKNDIK